MRTRPQFASLLLVAVACSSDVTNPPANPVVAAPLSAQWSGGEFPLLSPSFTGVDSLPKVLAGSIQLAVRRSGDTVYATMPDTNGAITLTVQLRDGGAASVGATAYGFESRSLAPAVDAINAIPWRAGGTTRALGTRAGQLVAVDYATDSVTIVSGDTGLTCPTGYSQPAPSADDPQLVTAKHGCTGPWIAEPTTGGSVAPDTMTNANAWFVVHVSPGHWLVNFGGSPGTGTLVRQPNGTFLETDYYACKEAHGVAISPRGDRVVLERCRALGPEPVFVAPTADTAYTLAIAGTGGAAFSPGGDTLYITNWSGTATILYVVDANTGAMLRQDTLSAAATLGAYGIAFDSQKPLLYLSDGQNVLVVDRVGYRLLATVRAPALANGSGYGADLYLDSATRQLFVVTRPVGVSNPEVTRFRLMP